MSRVIPAARLQNITSNIVFKAGCSILTFQLNFTPPPAMFAMFERRKLTGSAFLNQKISQVRKRREEAIR